MSTAKAITLDMDSIKIIAAAAAREAVEAMRQQHKEDQEKLEERLERRLSNYFGELTASTHIVQHERIDRILKFLDGLGNNIVGMLVKNLIIGAGVISIIGYVLWHK